MEVKEGAVTVSQHVRADQRQTFGRCAFYSRQIQHACDQLEFSFDRESALQNVLKRCHNLKNY